ncbi:hypothetical protein ACP4OV_020441 [Aristida adscensionis]
MSFDVLSAVQWWDKWQLRILVLGSLGIQWFLLVVAPMRKYSICGWFRKCIWLAYISSDALAIYALATLFNRHARASSTSSSCGGDIAREKSSLEVLWAPILLIHLGGQEELTAYAIEDNELWIRHTVTLVSQVTVALYAFSKSWHGSSEPRLLASAILLFIVGVFSFCEKPLALKGARIKRVASVTAAIQGRRRRGSWAVYLDDYFFISDWSSYFCPKSSSDVSKEGAAGLSEGDRVCMVLSDMSLLAAAEYLVQRRVAPEKKDVLTELGFRSDEALRRLLRGAFELIYTRANVVFTWAYLCYHLLLAPALEIAALTLFATSNKQGYDTVDVKTTYILLCLTSALDFLAVFIRQLVYKVMSKIDCPALCETVPGYNLMDAAVWMRGRRWWLDCVIYMEWNEENFYHCCERGNDEKALYKMVSEMVIADLVDAYDRDLASYRIFTVEHDGAAASAEREGSSSSHPAAAAAEPSSVSSRQETSSEPLRRNWALSEELQKLCGPEIRRSLRQSFDESVLLWHIATDLCFRSDDGLRQPNPGWCCCNKGMAGCCCCKANDDDDDDEPWKLRMKCVAAISNYMAHLLSSHPDMLLIGSRRHLVTEAMEEIEKLILGDGEPPRGEELRFLIDEWSTTTWQPQGGRTEIPAKGAKSATNQDVFHVVNACRLASELLDLPPGTRWTVMYRVWLGMLCYSAGMCRGYLHAKSLGEGGEFLSYVWLILSLKGAKSLADRLQMPEQ